MLYTIKQGATPILNHICSKNRYTINLLIKILYAKRVVFFLIVGLIVSLCGVALLGITTESKFMPMMIYVSFVLIVVFGCTILVNIFDNRRRYLLEIAPVLARINNLLRNVVSISKSPYSTLQFSANAVLGAPHSNSLSKSMKILLIRLATEITRLEEMIEKNSDNLMYTLEAKILRQQFGELHKDWTALEMPALMRGGVEAFFNASNAEKVQTKETVRISTPPKPGASTPLTRREKRNRISLPPKTPIGKKNKVPLPQEAPPEFTS